MREIQEKESDCTKIEYKISYISQKIKTFP